MGVCLQYCSIISYLFQTLSVLLPHPLSLSCLPLPWSLCSLASDSLYLGLSGWHLRLLEREEWRAQKYESPALLLCMRTNSEFPGGIKLRMNLCLKCHPCLTLSPSPSCLYPPPLTSFSWDHFLNKSPAHGPLSQGPCFWGVQPRKDPILLVLQRRLTIFSKVQL